MTELDALVATRKPKARSFWANIFVRLIKEKPLGTVSGVIVLALLIVGVGADVLAPYEYDAIFVGPRLSAASPEHLLGCDQLGRDILSRIIYGARVSVIIGLSAAAIATALATLIGVVSGYVGGKLDLVVQRFVDAWLCVPGLFLMLTLITIVGPGILQVILVMGFLSGIGMSRIVRGAVMGIRANPYIEATQALGCNMRRIVLKHILPNVTAPIIVLFTMTVGGAILAEATMSFLGLGIPPPIPTWGSMLSLEGRRYMILAPHLALWPGLFLAIVVWAINMLGDALRDLLDPRLRGGLGRYSRPV